MPNFSEFLKTQTAQAIVSDPGLTAAIISEQPSILAFFTDDAPLEKLHYHPEIKYFVCPEEGCPACMISKAPRDTFLFPVINLIRKRIEVLRVPNLQNHDGTIISDSLLMGITALMADPTNTDKIAKVTKSGNYRYSVEVVPGTIPSETKDLIEKLAAKFESGLATGTISLADFYPHLTAEEIREVPSIYEELKLCGLLEDDSLDVSDAA